MTMQRENYPPDWEAIALAKKDSADWHCEHCGRPCRRPGQRWLDFANEVAEYGYSSEFDKPQRFTLTVAHLDQNPQNNEPSNLAALCAPCHLKHDRPYRLYNRRRKRERQGQLNLLEGQSHA